MALTARQTNALRAGVLLSPAYLWLTVAVFLPLSAMLFFSFLSAAPFTTDDWHFTTSNYTAFFSRSLYPDLLGRSLLLSAVVTLCCVIIGYPCAYVLAKQIKGRSREALFLLIILPFWSNSLVRIFSWAIVLRGNGIIDHTIEAILPVDVSINLMFSFPAIVIGLVHSYLPYVILTCYLALQAIDDTLIDAARSLGAPFRTIFVRLILPLSLPGLAAGAVEVVLRAHRQEFAQAHADGVGKEVGQAEDQHRQPADLGHALGLCTGETGDDGKGGDDAVIAAIDDLLEVFLGVAEGMRLAPVCLPVHRRVRPACPGISSVRA